MLTRLVVRTTVVPMPPPEAEPPYQNATAFPRMPIPPSSAHSGVARWRISPSDYEAIMRGERCLLLYGRLAYEDGRGEEHVTRFCCYWYVTNPPSPRLSYSPVGPASYIDYT
jgi:hypothetical protein